MVAGRKGRRQDTMSVVDLMPSTSLRRDLAFLTTLEPEVLKSFCVVALENLAGIRTFESKLESVAEKFGLEAKILKKAIESLAYLFPSMAKEVGISSLSKTFLSLHCKSPCEPSQLTASLHA